MRNRWDYSTKNQNKTNQNKPKHFEVREIVQTDLMSLYVHFCLVPSMFIYVYHTYFHLFSSWVLYLLHLSGTIDGSLRTMSCKMLGMGHASSLSSTERSTYFICYPLFWSDLALDIDPESGSIVNRLLHFARGPQVHLKKAPRNLLYLYVKLSSSCICIM